MDYIRHKSEESVEDYLETIHILSQRLPVVRSVDIATELHYSKPSISIAMKNLRARRLCRSFPRGIYHVDRSCKEIALKTYERHVLLRDWLIRLGVAPIETSSQDACKMEHAISAESFAAIKKSIAGTHEIIAILVNNAFKTVQQSAKDKEDICRRADARQRYLTQDFTL